MVFGCRTQHRRPANINFFDQCIAVLGAGQRCFKRIEIDHQQINGFDILLCHRSQMVVKITPGEQAAMNFWMQRFDAPAHNFRKASDVCHIGHINAGITQRAGGAACR